MVLEAGSLWEFIEGRAAKTPNTTTSVDERGRALTFQALRERAERTAAGLHAIGIGEGAPAEQAAPATMGKVQELDPVASHASWMENFPWTRLAGTKLPTQQKPMVDLARMRLMSPKAVRDYLGDGNFGGYYERPDEDMLAFWKIAVEETRALLEGPWA